MPADALVSTRRFDFSRETFEASKHRRSVIGLQGRVAVEADANEQRRIDLYRSDTTDRDVIGPAGVPASGGGFLITGGGPDLKIGAGRIYVDGILCENDKACTLQTQPDLPVAAIADIPGFEAAAKAFAVELRVWERDRTPFDDASMLEKALGGPDTSARTEIVWQVVLKAQNDPNATCATAVVDVAPIHNGRLSAQAPPSAAARDCTLPPLAGYQGLENQLYRVEIHKGGPAGTATFKWSRENGSVLTGLPAGAGAVGQSFTVLSVGADQTLGLADNQWIELIDDAIELADGVGPLCLIQHVDPGSRTITLTAPPSLPVSLARNAKARRWDQTDPSQTAGVPTVANGWIALENGVQVRFDSGTYQPGDYWLIPARTAIDEATGTLEFPNTPQPARFAPRRYAKLAVVPFDGANFGVAQDCRPIFETLVDLTKRKSVSCCTVSVGDGKTTHGDFTDIQKAIQSLPPAGGEVCIQAGDYKQSISLVGLNDIRIHGCGAHTRLLGDGSAHPIVLLQDSQRIEIRDLAIASDAEAGLALLSSAAGLANKAGLQDVEIEGVEFTARDQTAIVCAAAANVRIVGNTIRIKQLAAPLSLANEAGFSPAIFLQADAAVVERNTIVCDAGKAETTPFAGLQIAGGSTGVDVRRNRIAGGNGNGITLGSVTFITQEFAKQLPLDYAAAMKDAKTNFAYASGLTLDAGGCVQSGGGPNPTGADGNPLVPVSDGALLAIRILDNDISGMGGSGVADLALPGELGLVLVALIEIERNAISGCATLERGKAGASNALLPGRGGIALASSEYATLRDNVIEGNGPDSTRSICGVWTGLSFGLVIERNRLVNNAPFADSNQAPEPGPRGGVVIEMAAPFINPFAATPVETGFPAARVSENIVISSSGPALAILGLGVVVVADNELTSHGCDHPAAKTYPLEAARSKFGGYAAFVWNLAWPLELASFVTDFLSLGKTTLSQEYSDKHAPAPASYVVGGTSFSNNHVRLDGPPPDAAILPSAVAVLSVGDIGLTANSFEASLEGSIVLIADAIAVGWSVRVEANRFQERLGRALLSAASWGLINTTSENQGTHCFFAAGKLLLRDRNLSLIHAIDENYCAAFEAGMEKTVNLAGLKLENAQ